MVGKRGRFRRSYPEPVKRRFRAMQDDLPYKVTLVEISNHFYVYKLVSELNESTGRYRLRRGQCIGKITDDGIYVPSKIRSELDIETAKAVILANGGKVVMPTEKQQTFDYAGIQLTEQEEKILTCLSMNARLTAPQIGRIVGMPAEHVTSRIKSLENQLGIKYVADIDLGPLGYSQFLILVKFQGERPNPKLLKEELEKEPHVLFAAFTSGSYDLMILIISMSGMDASIATFHLNRLTSLRRLTSKWFTSTFLVTYGVIPLRRENFDLLVKDIWHRSKDHNRPESDQLTKNDFLFLKAFNDNPVEAVINIETTVGLSKGSGRYILERLEKRGIINSVTMTAESLSLKYNASILISIVNEELFSATRSSLLEYIVAKHPNHITNTFSLVGDISTPRGTMILLPIIQNGELEATIEKLNENVNGIEIATMILSQIFIGKELHRRFDNAYAKQVERLAVFFKRKEYLDVLNNKQDYLLYRAEEKE